MKQSCVLFLMALLFLPAPMQAQQRKPQARKTATKKVADAPAENPRFAEMLSATQRLVIVDSVLADSAAFLRSIPVNTEEGRVSTYNQFFSSTQQPKGYVYVNELGYKCIFSMAGKDGHTRLYTSDKVSGEWSRPEPLTADGDDGLYDHNFPFLLPDGQTLYFAAKGGESIGGYDIYRTRIDTRSGHYLKPENIGLPFNSEADDFMLTISEQDSVGFFVTSRKHLRGKVCVYCFIPSESRQIYNIDEVGESRLRSLARIERISDTWGGGNAHERALSRLNALRQRLADGLLAEQTEREFVFIVDDNRTYTRMSDFRDSDNVGRMRDLLSLRSQTGILETALNKARDYFSTASSEEKQQLRSEIVQSEQQLETLLMQIQQLEKEIRNNEINN